MSSSVISTCRSCQRVPHVTPCHSTAQVQPESPSHRGDRATAKEIARGGGEGCKGVTAAREFCIQLFFLGLSARRATASAFSAPMRLVDELNAPCPLAESRRRRWRRAGCIGGDTTDTLRGELADEHASSSSLSMYGSGSRRRLGAWLSADIAQQPLAGEGREGRRTEKRCDSAQTGPGPRYTSRRAAGELSC